MAGREEKLGYYGSRVTNVTGTKEMVPQDGSAIVRFAITDRKPEIGSKLISRRVTAEQVSRIEPIQTEFDTARTVLATSIPDPRFRDLVRIALNWEQVWRTVDVISPIASSRGRGDTELHSLSSDRQLGFDALHEYVRTYSHEHGAELLLGLFDAAEGSHNSSLANVAVSLSREFRDPIGRRLDEGEQPRAGEVRLETDLVWTEHPQRQEIIGRLARVAADDHITSNVRNYAQGIDQTFEYTTPAATQARIDLRVAEFRRHLV